MNEYIEHNRQNNLFFDEDTDEELVKFREKFGAQETRMC